MEYTVAVQRLEHVTDGNEDPVAPSELMQPPREMAGLADKRFRHDRERSSEGKIESQRGTGLITSRGILKPASITARAGQEATSGHRGLALAAYRICPPPSDGPTPAVTFVSLLPQLVQQATSCRHSRPQRTHAPFFYNHPSFFFFSFFSDSHEVLSRGRPACCCLSLCS